MLCSNRVTIDVQMGKVYSRVSQQNTMGSQRNLENKSTDKFTKQQLVKYPVLPQGGRSLPELQVELLHEFQVTGGDQVALPRATPRSDLIL